MQLFDLVNIVAPEVSSDQCKIHLAVHNGIDDPLDVYFAGNFEPWQAEQTRKNFKRPYVIGLIALPHAHHWLFAGAYHSRGFTQTENPLRFHYDLERIKSTDELNGRLVIEYQRTGRSSYRNAETCSHEMCVVKVRGKRLSIPTFPGYARTVLTKQDLDILVFQKEHSWQSALASVGGVYVITDRRTGKLYVGSATGEEGIWGRWCDYAQNGHGGNLELKKLLQEQGPDYAAHFQYGILETADSRASSDDILARESHWKRLLMTRMHGHNAN